jgi:two-component system nitrate/nitrite response regulator NarL
MNEIEDTPVIAKTTILIVAHVRLYREGLAALLNSREHLEVSSTADDCETTLRAIATSAPDVAVIDITVPGALEIIPALRSSAAGTKVIAFALHDDEGQIIACIEAGASGYVTADSSLSALIATIEGVARDELPCSPRIAATFVRRLAERAARKELPIDAVILTGRERQVLRLLREGLSNKEIGQQLNIAEATVKNHVHHLLEKLDVSSRNQAVARFARVLDTDPSVSAARANSGRR